MAGPIAFVSQSSAKKQQLWLDHLRDVLPEEEIIPFDEITERDLKEIDLAIVDDPDPEDLKKLPALTWVQSLWAGGEKMVLQLQGSTFKIVRLEDPEMALKMAEAVVAWSLYLHRDMPTYTRQQREGIWQELNHTAAGGRHIGLIGLGKLGLAAANALRGLHFDVSAWSRSLKEVEDIATYHGQDGLKQMLQRVDIVVCLVPLTDETRGLINAERLQWMKPGTSLVNFARGAIIDTSALLAVLDDGHLKHAVLDVFDQEPLPQKSPFWQHPNVSVLPHISAPTNRETASKLVAENIKSYRDSGQIPKSVDLVRGY